MFCLYANETEKLSYYRILTSTYAILFAALDPDLFLLDVGDFGEAFGLFIPFRGEEVGLPFDAVGSGAVFAVSDDGDCIELGLGFSSEVGDDGVSFGVTVS